MNISYHWSPSYNHDSILKRGLLIPSKHPRLTKPVTCSEGHRNPHISLGRTPIHAWSLSGGFLLYRCREQGLPFSEIPVLWDLWEIHVVGLRNWRNDDYELNITKDIRPSRLKYVASRSIHQYA